MPRTTVLFSPPQWVWLQQEAERIGISINELIRRLIDKARGE
jgi:hypothetical protein